MATTMKSWQRRRRRDSNDDDDGNNNYEDEHGHDDDNDDGDDDDDDGHDDDDDDDDGHDDEDDDDEDGDDEDDDGHHDGDDEVDVDDSIPPERPAPQLDLHAEARADGDKVAHGHQHHHLQEVPEHGATALRVPDTRRQDRVRVDGAGLLRLLPPARPRTRATCCARIIIAHPVRAKKSADLGHQRRAVPSDVP